MDEEFTKPPKVFISYAWEDDVKIWVRAFAKQLRKDGVETVLDQWDTHYGDQLPEFMEKAVRESDFVILVCTPKYKMKSDKREGGVGYEGHIITAEIFQKNNHRKFITVLRKGNWDSALPSWAAGKLSMDLRGDPYSKKNYQELLRVLHNKWYTPPPVGKPPDFPDEEDDIRPIVRRKPLVSKDDVDKFVASLRNFARKLIPLLRVIGVLIIVGALFWASSWAVLKFIALVPTPQATTTATQRPAAKATSTKTPVPPTKTIRTNVTPTKTRTPAPTSLPTEITDAKDVSMVLVSAGEFTMGSDNGDADEKPVQIVFVRSFYIDKFEVSNTLYKICVEAGVCIPPKDSSSFTRPDYFSNPIYADYPVIHVDWYMSNSYCEWRTARLPTEVEWEKAAHGVDDSPYPWGNEINCNFSNYYGCVGDTQRAGSYEIEKNLFGIYDMVGNVSEWVSTAYRNYPYANDGRENPNTLDLRVRRGGSWDNYAYSVRVTYRDKSSPSSESAYLGFRCAKDATP